MSNSLIIIEDEALVRDNLNAFFSQHPRIQVVATYLSIEAVLEQPLEHTPDLILLDIALPGKSALEGIPRIKELYPDSDIIMLSSNENPETIFESIQLGAVAYLSKKSSLESIASAIETVLRGESFMSPSIARLLFNKIHAKQKPDYSDWLTSRQLEIIQGLAEGLSYKLIADKLHISIETVRDHIKTIYRKLHINSRNELVIRYLNGELRRS